MNEQQLARPELGREIATTGDGMDITRGYVGPLLTPFDSVLRSRGGNDLAIYEQVLSDAQVKTVFGQRTSAVVQREWQVDAGGDRRIDKQAAEWWRSQLHKIGWDRVTEKMLYSVFYGYAVAELIYAREDDKIAIAAIKVRNRRRFRFAADGGLRMLTYADMHQGVPCEAPYFWHLATGADHDDEPYGLGLAHWLYWPVLFKRNGMKFWLTFLEKFGMPTAVGKYDHNTATPGDKAKLLAATHAIQSDSGIILPQDMAIELLAAGRSGTADYKTLHDTMDATIAKVVLGQTASTEGTPGRLGNDDLQGDVRLDIIKADADLICESFNLGPITWLTRLNFPGAAIPRVYRVVEEPEDLTARAERDGKVKGLGFKPSLAYVQETYGGEWMEQAPSQPAEQPAQAEGEQAAAFAEAAQPVDPAEAMSPRMEQDLQPVIRDWAEQLRAIVEESGDLETVRARLLELAPQLSLDQYAQLLAEGLTAAGLAGRNDIEDEVR